MTCGSYIRFSMFTTRPWFGDDSDQWLAIDQITVAVAGLRWHCIYKSGIVVYKAVSSEEALGLAIHIPLFLTESQDRSPVPAVSAWCEDLDCATGRLAAEPLQPLATHNRLGNRAAGWRRASKVERQQEALDAAGDGGAISRQLLQQRGDRDHLVERHHLQAPACPRRISQGLRCAPASTTTTCPMPAPTSSIGRKINALRTDALLPRQSCVAHSERITIPVMVQSKRARPPEVP